MFTDKIGFEVDAFYYSTEPSSLQYTGVNITEIPLHARLTYNAPLGAGLGFVFGLGYAYNMWGEDATKYFHGVDSLGAALSTNDTDGGPGALIGFRFGNAGKVSMRVDLTGDYITSPINDTTSSLGSPVAQDSRVRPGPERHAQHRFWRPAAHPEGLGQGRRAGQDRPLPEHPARDRG